MKDLSLSKLFEIKLSARIKLSLLLGGFLLLLNSCSLNAKGTDSQVDAHLGTDVSDDNQTAQTALQQLQQTQQQEQRRQLERQISDPLAG